MPARLTRLFIIFLSISGMLLTLKGVSLEAASSTIDAIALRVIPNNLHYSPERWYKNNVKKQGSPQSLLVDGYQAVKDGRSVYVNAGNVDLTAGKLYTNIYLISYNQKPETATVEIFNSIIKNWKFNKNLTSSGDCSISSINCSSSVKCKTGYKCNTDDKCIPDPMTACLSDSDCPEDVFCDSPKSKVVRDTRKLSDLREIKILLDDYHSTKGHFPILSAGTYMQNKTLSTWPSWQMTFAKDLKKDLPVNPINSLGGCGSTAYDPSTCWDEKAKRFSGYNPIIPEFLMPKNSNVYVYTTDKNGGSYVLCGSLESSYAGSLASSSCGAIGAGFTYTTCGDGKKQLPNDMGIGGPSNDGFEQCDKKDTIASSISDSSVLKQYHCSAGCVFDGGWCGDTKVQSGYGEQCEAPGSGTSMFDPYDCVKCIATGGWCGDGKIQAAYEKCEAPGKGTSVADQYVCSACKWSGGWCGDATVQAAYETCEAPGTGTSATNQYACASCKWSGGWCGDSIKQGAYGEICDSIGGGGTGPSDPYDCVDCTSSGGWCGDSVVQALYETCEAPGTGTSATNQYACASCKWSGGWCGDSIKQGAYGETCEAPGKGTSVADQYVCSACKWSGGWCGDATVQAAYETCEAPGTGTSATNQYACASCKWSGGWCGDFIKQVAYGETCDSSGGGGTGPSDPYDCIHCIASGGWCGDSVVQASHETCEAPGTGTSATNQYACTSCKWSGGWCGNGTVQAAYETCESAGTGTSATNQYACTSCKWSGGWCGDGTVQAGYGEECDEISAFCASCRLLPMAINLVLSDGTGDGVVYDSNNNTNSAANVLGGTFLKISGVRPTPYIWIPNSGNSKVAQIRTFTKCVAYTAPIHADDIYSTGKLCPKKKKDGWISTSVEHQHPGTIIAMHNVGMDPARSAVNLSTGDAWIANRNGGSITKIGYKNDGSGDYEVKKTCNTSEVAVSGNKWVEGVMVDKVGDVWAANFNADNIQKFSGDDSSCATLKTVSTTDPFGLAMDSNDNIWVVAFANGVSKVTPAWAVTHYPANGGYGITVDKNNYVWLGGFETFTITNAVIKFPIPVTTESYHIPGRHGLGISSDTQGNVWVATLNANSIIKVNSSGGQVFEKPCGGIEPRGACGDSEGNMWVVNNISGNIRAYNNAGNDLGIFNAYESGFMSNTNVYSDMTGLNRELIFRTGSWYSKTYDGGIISRHWGHITWTQIVPANTSVKLYVRTGNTSDLSAVSWVSVATWNAYLFTSPQRQGRYIQVKVELESDVAGVTPVVTSMRIEAS